jgi:acyltransferase
VNTFEDAETRSIAAVNLGRHESIRPSTSSPQPVADERITFVDNARAIGIVLVVLGHAPGLPGPLSNFIFAFHMPLFFFLSGLVVGAERLKMPIGRRALLLARTLLLPYAFYFVVAYLYWLVAKRHGLRAEEFGALSWWQPLSGFVYGTADSLYVDVVLWFFPCLFVTALVHHIARKVLPPAATSAVFVALALALILLRTQDMPRWPWSSDCAVVGLAFYAVGAMLNRKLKHPRPAAGRGLLAAIGIVAAIGCLALVAIMGSVDLNHLAFGAYPLLYLPMAAIGIVGTLAVSKLLRASPLARWLSANTLVIFPLHFLMFSVFTGVAIEGFGLDVSFKEASAWLCLLYTALALLLSWPASIVLRRYVPILFHQRRGRSRTRVAPSSPPL